ncbi:acyl-CoA N-acyltransferase [Coniella lustricola]|uniref:Acyl-CoA N-acyltransferase n=1 Tax=Coniella lustricola TaxID=2025994 RepID=A0A2T3A526_9PEZI|nr:acyl-CoA N-acyltransferase [Coniella lustricola]
MSTSFSLHPITEDDIPALAEIDRLSFANDRHTLLKAAHPTRPYDHAAGTPEMIKYRLSLPTTRVEMTKAVDDQTGDILGYGGWGKRLDLHPQSSSTTTEETKTENGEDESSKPPPQVVAQDYVKTESPHLDALEQLEEMTSAHLADYQGRIMPPGTRAMYLVGLSVHPDHQGRGVGRALIKHGTDRADAERVFCWVHSSDDAAPMYRKCGFEVNDTLEIDLDHWASQLDIKPPIGDEKWGTYTFRYMIREPQPVERR